MRIGTCDPGVPTKLIGTSHPPQSPRFLGLILCPSEGYDTFKQKRNNNL